MTATTEPVTTPPDDTDGAPWRPDLGTLVGLVLVVVAVGFGGTKLADNSFFTHLATGRLMLDEGIVRSDAFTWTSGGESVVVQSWLASLLYGLIDEVAGFAGLRLLTAVLSGVLAGLVWQLSGVSRQLFPRLVAVVPAMVVGVTFWNERPLLLGLIALALTLLVVERDLDQRLLAAVGFVWINVHGSWPLGIVLLLALGAGRWLDGGDLRPEKTALTWLGGGLLVGGVLNPYGPAMLLFPLELLGRSDTLRHVVEWQSPDFAQLAARFFLLGVVAAIVAVVHRPSWRATLPLVVFAAAALLGRRNLPVATLVLVPIIAAGFPFRGTIDVRRTSPPIRMACIALGAAALAIAVVSTSGPAVDLDRYPVEAVNALEEAGLAPDEARVIHPDIVGNYLDLRLGPVNAVWIDDRYELHDDELIADYLVVLNGTSGWAEVLDRWNAEVLLWHADAAVVELADEVGGWSELHRDDRWVVLCRDACG